jgi:hypothetical protein
MKKITLIASVLMIILMLASCNPQKKIAGNYTYTIRCLGVELDGSQTVEAWGTGRYRFDATEQALKNAVYAVIFDGIRDGVEGCEVKPLLTEVNAKEKYEAYFNKFFADKGEFYKYISWKDERIGHKFLREKKGATEGTTRSVVVRVLRPQLKEKLIQDNILKTK